MNGGRESSYLSESNNMIFRHFNGVYKVDDISTLYSRVKVLGAGSFGEVYEAINLKSNAACAVKVCAKERIQSSNKLSQLLKQELEMLQQLDHPHIVHVLELIEDEENIYFIMELIEHGNLMEVLDEIHRNDWKFDDKDAANLIK